MFYFKNRIGDVTKAVATSVASVVQAQRGR